MSSKSRVLYDAAFLSVRNLIPCLLPVQSLTDFETALFGSIKNNLALMLKVVNFNTERMSGKVAASTGLSVCKDKIFVVRAKMILSLPLLPAGMIFPTLNEFAAKTFLIHLRKIEVSLKFTILKSFDVLDVF